MRLFLRLRWACTRNGETSDIRVVVVDLRDGSIIAPNGWMRHVRRYFTRTTLSITVDDKVLV